MKFFIVLVVYLNTFAFNEVVIYKVSDKEQMTRAQFVDDLIFADIIVMGEKHYTSKIQREEANIIRDVLKVRNSKFTLGWEFLNASDNIKIRELISELRAGKITTDEFLFETQKNQGSYVYAPIIDETLKFDAEIMGVNLSREEKAPVVKNGIGALDPKLLPPDYKEGGADYYERFYEVMKSHATDEQIKNYFSAQSLVDDVSAYKLLGNENPLKFLIIGAFHSMFNDGVVARLKARAPNLKIVNIEIIDEDTFDGALVDPRYGPRTDYLILVK